MYYDPSTTEYMTQEQPSIWPKHNWVYDPSTTDYIIQAQLSSINQINFQKK